MRKSIQVGNTKFLNIWTYRTLYWFIPFGFRFYKFNEGVRKETKVEIIFLKWSLELDITEYLGIDEVFGGR